MSRRIDRHSMESFGSNTIHRVPSAIDSLSMLKSRRTLRYRHSLASAASVRAPQTRMPSAGEVPDAVDARRVEQRPAPAG